MIEMIKTAPEVVTAVILDVDTNNIVCVSRKTDHTDFGLPGGKVDLDDSTKESGLIREIKEETGLTVKEEDMALVLSMYKNRKMSHTYFITKYRGELRTNEPHVLKWAPFEEVTKGTYSEWNTMLYDIVSKENLIK